MKNLRKEIGGIVVKVCCSVVLVSLLMLPAGAATVDPVLQVRFANPKLDCETGIYCLDVEFQSDTPNKELFGMNVRFFYEAASLDFIDFAEFEGGYGPFNPSPPQVRPGNDASGPELFGFEGAAVYVNGAVQLIDYDATPIHVSLTDWTKLFSVRFAVSDPEALNGASFCPSVFWDLESAPEKGGFLSGSNGVVMTVVAEPPMESAKAGRGVVQFNGEYDAAPAGPKMYPDSSSCVLADCQTETPQDAEDADNEGEAIEGEAIEGEASGDDSSEREPAEGERSEEENTEGEPAEGEGGAVEESEEGEVNDDEATPVNGCNGCGGFKGKSVRDALADWLLVGLSMLVLLTAVDLNKRC